MANSIIRQIHPKILIHEETDMYNHSTERLSGFAYKHQWISTAAYYKAMNRDFESGLELDDWFLSEQEFMKMLITHYLNICSEDGGLTLIGLQRFAKSLGIENAENFLHKDELIHIIQIITNNDPCFNSHLYNDCDLNQPCLWRAECKKLIAHHTS